MMSHLRLIDEVALTFYCSGCHEHTQNLQHECSGQMHLMADQATRMINDNGATPYMVGMVRYAGS